MSISKSLSVYSLKSPINFSHRKESKQSSSLSSSKISISNQSISWSKEALQCIIFSRNLQINITRRRSLVVRSGDQPGAPPPSKSPFNFLNWVIGVVRLITVVVPFVSKQWASFLKIRAEVETTVDKIEEIVEEVEKVAEEVEKVAEDISKDLPQDGNLRKAVDFVENVAERASKDAHQVENLINKVHEAEDKVEEYFVESLAEENARKPPKDTEPADEYLQEANDATHKNN